MALAACGVAAAWAQPAPNRQPQPRAAAGATSTMMVHVVDGQGAALPGATVAVQTQGCYCSNCSDPQACDCCIDQVRVTDATGDVKLLVPAGTYSLHASLEGFEVVEAQVTVRPGAATRVTLTMASKVTEAVLRRPEESRKSR